MNASLIITVLFVLAYYGCAIWQVRQFRITTQDLCVASVVIAMTVMLEAIRVPLPTGATLSLLSPVPLLLLALLWDHKLAILSGWVCGVLAMLLNPYWQVIHWGQFLVEHMVCFSALGFAGVFGSFSRKRAICGIVLASVLKVSGHILSGVMFFSQNAWDSWGAWGYSFAFNLSENIPLCILSGIAVFMMPLKTIDRAIGGKKK